MQLGSAEDLILRLLGFGFDFKHMGIPNETNCLISYHGATIIYKFKCMCKYYRIEALEDKMLDF